MSPSSPALPRAVTFDYWNTLCHEPDMEQRPALVAQCWSELAAAADVRLEPSDVIAAFGRAREEHWAAWHENRQFTGEHAAESIIATLGGAAWSPSLSASLADAFHACSDAVDVTPLAGVGEVLEHLKAADVKVGIVCDVGLMPSSYLRRHLDRHGLLGYFDHWSFSDEVGVYKPDRRIFEHALSGLGDVLPADAVHVGDRRRTDIAGAQAMGMRAVRITAVFDDDDPDQGPSGDVIVSGYDEFFEALGLG